MARWKKELGEPKPNNAFPTIDLSSPQEPPVEFDPIDLSAPEGKPDWAQLLMEAIKSGGGSPQDKWAGSEMPFMPVPLSRPGPEGVFMPKEERPARPLPFSRPDRGVFMPEEERPARPLPFSRPDGDGKLSDMEGSDYSNALADGVFEPDPGSPQNQFSDFILDQELPPGIRFTASDGGGPGLPRDFNFDAETNAPDEFVGESFGSPELGLGIGQGVGPEDRERLMQLVQMFQQNQMQESPASRLAKKAMQGQQEALPAEKLVP